MGSGKVAIVVPDISGGGAEVVALRWADALRLKGFSVDVLVTHRPLRSLIPDSVPSAVIVGGRGASSIQHLVALRKAVIVGQYDSVISLMTFTNILTLVACRSIVGRNRPKVVISEHNLHGRLRQLLGLRFKVQALLAKRLYRHADAWIAVSHPVAAEMAVAYGLSTDNLYVVPNPVQVEASKVDCASNPNVMTPDDGSAIDLVFVGRMVEQKRPYLVLDVAQELTERHSRNVSVHFYGDGPMRASLESAAISSGVDHHFHGWVQEWHRGCRQGQILILPSLVEGFGNVLVEAASVGIASVVSSRCVGISDACVPGLSAELAIEDSVSSYTSAVLRAELLTLSDMGPWLANFSVERAAENLGTLMTFLQNLGTVRAKDE